MQQTFRALVCAATTITSLVFAADDDTVKTYRAEEMVITATRTAINPADAPSPVQVISADALQQINGTTMADLLRTINGVYLKEYGSAGAIKTLSFRGMSAENILILLNGSPINDPQNGIVDVNLLPLDAVHRVEVLYGGASALYGADASGGVINIITRQAQDSVHARILREAGSYGEQRTALELQERKYGVGIVAGASQEQGFDDYPFTVSRTNLTDTVMNRNNNDYKRQQVYGTLDAQPLDIWTVNASAQYVKFDRGVPGSLSYTTETARQNDEVFRATAGSKLQMMENLSLDVAGSYTHSNEQYYEPGLWGNTDTWYHENYYSLNSYLTYTPIEEDQISLGVEYQGGKLNADGLSYGFPFGMSATRYQRSTYLSNVYMYKIGGEWFSNIGLFQSLREDAYIDKFGSAFSPKFGANVLVYQPYNIHIRGSWGKNFRVPTFNDLYYPNYSNSDLSPERSSNVDAGIIGNLDRTGRQTLQITYFAIFSKDKIAYGANYLPYNIGKAENNGVEIRYDYFSSDRTFNAYCGVAFIDAINTTYDTLANYKKQLPYIPQSQGTFGISFLTDIGRINIQHAVVGTRYKDDVNTLSLPAYSITNVNIAKQIACAGVQLTLRAEVNNVFDTDYQIIDSYPMPGRTVRVSAAIEY